MVNFKHKVFLLIAKWIPVAVAAGILINNILAMLDVKDVILDLFDITVGSSLAFVVMMYACSYVFNFCYWHKIVITYDLFVLLYILLIRYTNIGECSDGLLLTIGMWTLAFNGQTACFNDRQTINAEMFGLYKSQVDADFALYKNQRDGFDVTNARVGELEKEVAVLRATRPYQDALIQAAIARVAEQAEFNLFRRTCRMISGEVVLPNTPTVTGYSSYDPCACRAAAATPSAN